MIGLKYLRMVNELSLQQVADAIGVTKQTISKWEKGTTIPEARVEQLMEYFHAGSESLITREVKSIKDDTDFNITNEEVFKLNLMEEEKLKLLILKLNDFKGKMVTSKIESQGLKFGNRTESFLFKIIKDSNECFIAMPSENGSMAIHLDKIESYDLLDQRIKIYLTEGFTTFELIQEDWIKK